MKYSVDDLVRDLFLEGHVDMGIFNSTYLREFFTTVADYARAPHTVLCSLAD